MRAPSYYQGSSGDWYYSVILNYDAGSDMIKSVVIRQGGDNEIHEVINSWNPFQVCAPFLFLATGEVLDGTNIDVVAGEDLGDLGDR